MTSPTAPEALEARELLEQAEEVGGAFWANSRSTDRLIPLAHLIALDRIARALERIADAMP